MMSNEPLSRQDLDRLLHFLPLFASPGFQPVEAWASGESTPDGTITSFYPVYAAEVIEFFQLAGRPVFEAILALSETHRLPIHWGAVGFSLNVDFGERQHVGICDGFPPSAVFGQTLYTAFARIGPRIAASEELIATFREKAERTGLFVPAGGEIKCVIQSPLADEQIQQLVALFRELAEQVQKHGLRQEEEP